MATFDPAPRVEAVSLEDTTGMLKDKLLKVAKAQNARNAGLIDMVVQLSRKAGSVDPSEEPEALEELCKYIEAFTPEELMQVADALHLMLTLENLAEDVRLYEEDIAEDADTVTKRTSECLARLLKAGGTPASIAAAVEQMDLDFVFTAHPTQVMRRGMLLKCQEIRAIMHRLHQQHLTAMDRQDLMDKLRLQIHMLWRTDSLRRQAPSPQEEHRSLLSYLPGSIFKGMALFMRRLDHALTTNGLPPLPLEKVPFRFSSWMGGDRDGNPNVTAVVTQEVVLTARIDAASLCLESVHSLMMDLSMWEATPEFLELVAKSTARISQRFGDKDTIMRARRNRGFSAFFAPNPENEPYRRFLQEVRDRLWETREALQTWLAKGGPMPAELARPCDPNCVSSDTYGGPYVDKEELLQSLRAVRASLIGTGDALIAEGAITDLIRQVACFGLALTALDIRQESTRHRDAMDAVTVYLGLGSYNEWDEAQKVAFLEKELASVRPLIPAKIMQEIRQPFASLSSPILSSEVHEVLATFNMIARMPMDSLGTYVISMAQSASDVLCVRLFQKEMLVPQPMMRVAPLFETLDDLQFAPTALRTLFQSETYRKHHIHNNVQEVMIGYSDSGKDAGRMAAAWALYEAQELLMDVAKEFGVELIFFHGRGGTVGRGGGPVQVALKSQPQATIQKGRMRVTVQGETIERQFGETAAACRTMDTYLSALLEAELQKPAPVKPEWKAIMKELQEVSCKAYRSIVFEDPRFITYFRDVTPSAELGRANIGSRPAKRKAVDSVASIRAIPWIFAWTQTRFNLPVWLGVGEAIEAVSNDATKLATLRDMYQNFMFFRSLLDLLDMVFAKSDPNVAKLYDAGLATSDDLRAMSAELGKKFVTTRAAVHSLTQGADAMHSAKSVKWMRQKFDARNVYITPLNIMQVRCLRQTREAAAAGSPEPHLEDALLLTVKGIAAGLQNTG